jgi:hypothetical protein
MDLITQLSCPSFTLAAGLPSGFTFHHRPSRLLGGGEPCEVPAISLHSHHVSLVQWTNPLLPAQGTWVQIPWGDLCETGILLLALSRYKLHILVLTKI